MKEEFKMFTTSTFLYIFYLVKSSSNDPSVSLSFSYDDAPSPFCSLSSQRMLSCIPSLALNKQHFKNDFAIL